MRTAQRSVWLLFAALLLTACGDNAPFGPQGRGAHLVGGFDVSDTARAWLSESLTVLVRGSDGKPLEGEIVRFTAVPHDTASQTLSAVVAAEKGGETTGFIAVKTDARGEARVAVRLGPYAGTARVNILVPALGAEVSATYDVKPGAAHALRVPAERGLYPGDSFQPEVMVVDRSGNLRPERAVLSADWPGIEVAGGVVRARGQFGRGRLIARWGDLTDTLWITVAPPGRIAAVQIDGLTLHLVTQGTAGSDYRRIVSARNIAWPSWSPVDSTLVFIYGEYHFFENLYVAEPAGAVRKLIQTDVGLEGERYPRFGLDGSWIYFIGVPPKWTSGSVWRIRRDGTEAEQIGPESIWNQGDSFPSPSPDGRRILFVTQRNADVAPPMAIFDLATGTTASLEIPGHSPRWSPSGEWIAYITTIQHPESQVRLIRPDGSQDHAISGKYERYGEGLDWSPDGEWVVVYSLDHDWLEVIEVATGLTFPLPNTKGMRQPSWGR